MKQEIIFSRFERFWHWAQAALIIGLLITGFTVHGSISPMRWGTASHLHAQLAWALIVLWVFAAFWHAITGEWRQYLPTTKGLGAVMYYYSVGIFQPGVHHPYRKVRAAKHNPMQRMAYLLFDVAIAPALWISGLLYMYYNDWPALGLSGVSLGAVAFFHTAAAFALVACFIGHVYMAFTGKPWWDYLASMITGKAEVAE